MFDGIPKWFIENHWCNGDSEVPDLPVDLVIMISYGAYKSGGLAQLTKATSAITHRACEIAKAHTEAVVVASPCKYLFPGSDRDERALRDNIACDYEVSPFWAEGMLNSVDEGLKLLKLILTRGIRAEHTVIVTGQSHSRFVRWLYGSLLVGCTITVICVPFETEYQADHRAKMQRTAWRWIIATFERHLAFAFLGRRIAKIHHSVD